MNDHGAGADFHVISDSDVPEHPGAASDHDAVAESGMTLASLVSRAAKCDALIKQHVFADLDGFPDHHAHPVIDEETASDNGSRVDIYSGQEPAHVGDDSWYKRYSQSVK